MTFSEMSATYQLARSEGLVLRYLSDVYKTLRPHGARQRTHRRARRPHEWLGELVRQTDSSLLDEWEELDRPGEGDPVDVVIAQHEAPTPARLRSRPTRGRSGCWSATRCSAASS